jgi:formylglycine-generating enzyme required for sulfatase activity
MTKKNLQLGGGYIYQWECAMLLALNYLYDPFKYSSDLYGLVVDFLGSVEQIILEGESQSSGKYLEDINLIQGPRRILIQVKSKQNEREQWIPSDEPLLKALYRFYKNYSSSKDPNTRYAFLSNCGFNPALWRVADAARSGALRACPEANRLHGQLERFAQNDKGSSVDLDLFLKMLGQAVLIEYLKIDAVEANIRAKLEAHGRKDWEVAYALLFQRFSYLSTQSNGGIVTAESVQELLWLQRRVEVAFEYDPQSVSPEKVDAAVGAFVGTLGISVTVIRLYSVTSGSIVLEIGLPSHIIPRLRRLLRSNNASLRLLGVKRVAIDPERETREEWNLVEGRYRLYGEEEGREGDGRHTPMVSLVTAVVEELGSMGRLVDDPVHAVSCLLESRAVEKAVNRAIGESQMVTALVNAEMVFVPAGPFLMGSDKGKDNQAYDDELPQHEVVLPGYWIGRYPVTNEAYREFIEGGGYQTRAHWTEAGWNWKRDRAQPGYWTDAKYNDPQQPVVGVTWYEAAAYCRWLSERAGVEVKLPSEAEWEKAARGTDGRIYPWGDAFDANKCNTGESGIGEPTPVGAYSPQGDSPYGCADMAGNVWEWCATKWENSYKDYKGDDDPEVSALRVLRGGSFDDDPRRARCACRAFDPPRDFWSDFGFRVVVVASPIPPRPGS